MGIGFVIEGLQGPSETGTQILRISEELRWRCIDWHTTGGLWMSHSKRTYSLDDFQYTGKTKGSIVLADLGSRGLVDDVDTKCQNSPHFKAKYYSKWEDYDGQFYKRKPTIRELAAGRIALLSSCD
jgi:hypothetical protein